MFWNNDEDARRKKQEEETRARRLAETKKRQGEEASRKKAAIRAKQQKIKNNEIRAKRRDEMDDEMERMMGNLGGAGSSDKSNQPTSMLSGSIMSSIFGGDNSGRGAHDMMQKNDPFARNAHGGHAPGQSTQKKDDDDKFGSGTGNSGVPKLSRPI